MQFPPLKRSLYMISGGFVMILLIFYAHVNRVSHSESFFIGVSGYPFFGTILPPILLTRGMPVVGLGLGAIITSLEIPVCIDGFYTDHDYADLIKS